MQSFTIEEFKKIHQAWRESGLSVRDSDRENRRIAEMRNGTESGSSSEGSRA